jgi:hypothetical protein
MHLFQDLIRERRVLLAYWRVMTQMGVARSNAGGNDTGEDASLYSYSRDVMRHVVLLLLAIFAETKLALPQDGRSNASSTSQNFGLGP